MKKRMIMSICCICFYANTMLHISANIEKIQPEVETVVQEQIENKRGFTIRKIDETTEIGLPGAVYMVSDPEKSIVMGYIVTGEDGYGMINVPYGTYLIQEIKAPQGYENDNFFFVFEANDKIKEPFHILTAKRIEDKTSEKEEQLENNQTEEDIEHNKSEKEEVIEKQENDQIKEETPSIKDVNETQPEQDKSIHEGNDVNKEKLEINNAMNEKMDTDVVIKKTDLNPSQKHDNDISTIQRINKQDRESVQTNDTSNLLLWGVTWIVTFYLIVCVLIRKMKLK